MTRSVSNLCTPRVVMQLFRVINSLPPRKTRNSWLISCFSPVALQPLQVAHPRTSDPCQVRHPSAQHTPVIAGEHRHWDATTAKHSQPPPASVATAFDSRRRNSDDNASVCFAWRLGRPAVIASSHAAATVDRCVGNGGFNGHHAPYSKVDHHRSNSVHDRDSAKLRVDGRRWGRNEICII